jgi:tetratricopeptide (TPR) repeat protein
MDRELAETAPAAPEVAWSDAQIGRYVYRRLLGSGGMGVVLAAHDPELDREVAIKLVVTGDTDDARPVREAQAMARLSHPNVVQVYEVVRLGARTAIVMELVEGEELGGWQKGRSWRAIVDAYVQASRGLAAAHRAGIVHRDFKPSNALVDRDGVVRVTDFGLARSASPGAPSSAELTGIAGTPVYMAPEQHRGHAVDARTDQWSLACALYEALYGRRPFASAEGENLADAVVRGAIESEPADSPVPRRIRTAIRRALSTEPDERFATVEQFAAALAPPPRRLPSLIAAAAAIALVIVVSVISTRRAPAPCQDLDGPMRAIWTPQTRADLRARLLATGVGLPEATVDRALRGLDAYAASWTATRTAVCMDSQHGVRSEAPVRCLDRGLSEVSGLLEGLAVADPATLRATSDAVAQLQRVTTCAEAQDTVAPTATPAQRSELAAAEDALGRATAALSLGQFERALPLVDRAVRASDPALAARALVVRGECEDRLGRHTDASATFQKAAQTAAQARDHVVVADALARGFLVEGDRLGHRADALRTRPYIELAVESAGRPDAVRAEWLHFVAIMLYDDLSHVDEAATLERESLAIRKRTLPEGHLYITDSMETLANIEALRRNFDESARLLKQVLEARIAARGPNDGSVAGVYSNLGVLEARRDNLLPAIEYLQRAVDIALAAGRPNTAAQYNLARCQMDIGRWRAAARSFETSLADSVRLVGEDSRDVAESAMYLGITLIWVQDFERGRAMLQRGIDVARRSGSPAIGTALAHAARLALHDGDRARARSFLSEAMKLPTTNLPLRSLVVAELARAESGCAIARPQFAQALDSAKAEDERAIMSLATVDLAECEIATGDVKSAEQRLDAELAWLTKAGADDVASAPVRALLAKLRAPR